MANETPRNNISVPLGPKLPSKTLKMAYRETQEHFGVFKFKQKVLKNKAENFI